MQTYKTVYKMENGVLIQNKQNKIEYVCPKGTKRTKTNPTLRDFAGIGYYPVKLVGTVPDYDAATERLQEKYELKNGVWEKSFIPVKKEA